MFKHWAYDEAHEMYTGCHEVTDTARPGIYKIWVSQSGAPTIMRLEPREDEIFEFSGGQMPTVLSEIESFWNAREDYSALGVCHKRGILLHGAPGCGKTAIVSAAIRRVLARNGLVIDMDQDVEQFLSAMPLVRQIEADRPVVVLVENIDHVCAHSCEELLEVMDGASSVGHNILYLCTTNNFGRVPERVKYRPSRIDTLIEVGLPDLRLRREYLRFLLCKAKDREAMADVLASESDGLSLAHVKELVLGVVVYKKKAGELAARLRSHTATEAVATAEAE